MPCLVRSYQYLHAIQSILSAKKRTEKHLKPYKQKYQETAKHNKFLNLGKIIVSISLQHVPGSFLTTPKYISTSTG